MEVKLGWLEVLEYFDGVFCWGGNKVYRKRVKKKIVEDRGWVVLVIVWGGVMVGRFEFLGYIFRFWWFLGECWFSDEK